MDLSFWLFECSHRLGRHIVSILVMMDLSFWLAFLRNLDEDARNGFNPCYDGFVILTCKFWKTFMWQWFVSILVMMDLSFWLWIQSQGLPAVQTVSILVMMDLSFWPLSIRYRADCSDVMFQSLLWWICHFDPDTRYSFRVEAMFQSLLWWICHFDIEKRGVTLEVLCFNPCYDGFVILTLQNQNQSWWFCRFQSLLWWICHFDRYIIRTLHRPLW